VKYLFLLLSVFFNLFSAELIDVTQKPKAALESISKHAIKIGSGDASDIYVFIDPLCKYSRELMKKIEANKMLQLTNSYYIMLYRLPRLYSEKTMQYINESKNQKQALKEIMVEEEIVDLENYKAK
jgi:thioredoxin-related protein